MLCGDTSVVQASVFDGLSFDPFFFQENGLAMPEVDIGRWEVAQPRLHAAERNVNRVPDKSP